MKSPTRAFPRMSTADIHLLKACTQARDVALVAWEQWRSGALIDTAGPRSQPMFSMLYVHLVSATGGPEEKLLKGVHKRSWYANQLMMAQMLPLLEKLSASDIRVLVMNDVSLVRGYYPDIGYRNIQCIDLLVPAADWTNSLVEASAIGWQQQLESSCESPGALSIATFKGPKKQCLRIWTNLFVAAPQQVTEARIWQAARNLDLKGQAITTLGPVDQVLSLAVDACRHAEPPLSLYADAVLLLKPLGADDEWVQLVWQAQRYECILPLRNMLGILQDNALATVPGWVLPALHKMAISHFELRQYHELCESPALRFKSVCLRLAGQFHAGGSRG